MLVVGAGDAAMEAAAQLAEQSTASVSISYRGDSLARAREANRKKVEALDKSRRLRLYLGSQVKSIDAAEVRLEQKEKPFVLGNDYVLVLIGGELPAEFLKKNGIDMRRFQGETMAIHLDANRKGSGRDDQPTRRRRRRVQLAYAAAGALVLAFPLLKGWDYYFLPPLERLHSPLHGALKPTGAWGHGVGVAATAFMLSNFLYAARKRWGVLRWCGAIRSWLDFHVFVGFMSPLVILFHAAFRSNNLLATGTSMALGIVMLSGIIGRFIYGMVPSVQGRALELDELAARFKRLRERARPVMAESRNPARLEVVFALATREIPGGWLPGLALRVPASALRLRFRVWRVRRFIPDAERRARFRDSLVRMNRIRFQIAFFDGLRNLLRTWRVLHASLAGFLVLAIAAHIAVSLFLGYGWR